MAIVVLEFKSSSLPDQAAVDQAFVYARDLTDFHRASHNLVPYPIVVLTGAAPGMAVKWDQVVVTAPEGLELDLPILCRGPDVMGKNGVWQLTPVRRRYPQSDPRQLLINTYRVLLTRGRDGVVIWVPPMPEDETEHILLAAGVRSIPKSDGDSGWRDRGVTVVDPSESANEGGTEDLSGIAELLLPNVKTWDMAVALLPVDHVRQVLDVVELTVARYPLVRLQTVDGVPQPFIYDIDWARASPCPGWPQEAGRRYSSVPVRVTSW